MCDGVRDGVRIHIVEDVHPRPARPFLIRSLVPQRSEQRVSQRPSAQGGAPDADDHQILETPLEALREILRPDQPA